MFNLKSNLNNYFNGSLNRKLKCGIFSSLRFFLSGFSIAAVLFAANLALAVPVNVNTADADTIGHM